MTKSQTQAMSLMERIVISSEAIAAFDQIRVNYLPQTDAVAKLDQLRRAAKMRPPGASCGGMMVVAPTGCGKTQTIERYKRIAETDAEVGTRPVLVVVVPGECTTSITASAILEALGVARPNAGTEFVRWRRAVEEMTRQKVELVIFDEFNEASRRPTMSRPIATAIRQWIMDRGVAPVAFFGSEDAAKVLALVPELLRRLHGEADLSPMNWHSEGDRELFINFVGDLDAAMVERGIVDCKADLASEDIAHGLWRASNGHLREICGVIRSALEHAVRGGQRAIHKSDLAHAFCSYPGSNALNISNPFV